MRVSLVFPPFYLASLYNLPPLGLIGLATVLSGRGVTCRVHDQVLGVREGRIAMGQDIYARCARDILEAEPDLAAFSAQCATYPAVLAIAGHLKRERPELPVVIGGHNASFVDVATLQRFACIDAIVRGEGEETFPELVEAYLRGGDLGGVAGVSWRAPEGIRGNPDRELLADLNTLPEPDYSFVPSLARYKLACGLTRSIAIVEAGRGCPHRCVYCSESPFWRRRQRTFAPGRLVDSIKRLRDERGAECLLISYDQFTAARGYVVEFCERMIEAGLSDTPWYCISRLDTVDEELLSLMRRAGCESMCYGVDSGSRRTLAYINKRIDETLLCERVRLTTDNAMTPTLSFIIGFPEEEPVDIDDTLSLALECGMAGGVSPLLQLPTVLPGSDLHAKTFGTLTRQVDTYFALGLEFDQGRRLAGDEELIDSDPSMFSCFYNVPCRGMSLPELDGLTRGFPLMVSFFPRSMFLLCRMLTASQSRVFLRFATYVSEKTGRDLYHIEPRDCREFFPGFALGLVKAAALPDFGHFGDVVGYETLAIDAAGAKGPPDPGDAPGLGMRPSLCSGVLTGRFAHDMTAIIEDLRFGVVLPDYPAAPSRLIFGCREGELEVSAVNDFGDDFLSLCDGSKSLGEIAAILRPVHGRDMDAGAFAAACDQAARSFAGMGLIRVGL